MFKFGRRNLSTNSQKLFSPKKVDILELACVVNKLRTFFSKKGYIEVYGQYRRHWLQNREDSIDFRKEKCSFPQTGQMCLEHNLLTNPRFPGVFGMFTIPTEEESKSLHSPHQLLFEFEGRGDFTKMKKVEKELLEYLEFGINNQFTEMDYEKACLELSTHYIDDEHQAKLCEKSATNIVLLEMFPERTSPFWNMAKTKHPYLNENGIFFDQYAQKVDVYMFGQKTVESGKKENDPHLIRKNFESVNSGSYAAKIRGLFGEDRVNKELDDFLSFDFFDRFSGSIDIHQFMSALKQIEPEREPFCHLP